MSIYTSGKIYVWYVMLQMFQRQRLATFFSHCLLDPSNDYITGDIRLKVLIAAMGTLLIICILSLQYVDEQDSQKYAVIPALNKVLRLIPLLITVLLIIYLSSLVKFFTTFRCLCTVQWVIWAAMSPRYLSSCLNLRISMVFFWFKL